MVNIEKDYIYGEEQQKKLKSILEAKFGTLKEMDRWSKHDFKNQHFNIEIKSRKNTYSAYPTTLITCNKIVEEPNKRLYFIFNFTDGVYYIRYKKALFDTFEKKMFSRINQAYDEKEYLYIPIQYLKNLETCKPKIRYITEPIKTQKYLNEVDFFVNC